MTESSKPSSIDSLQKNRWKAWLFALASAGVQWLQNKVHSMLPAPARILAISSSFWQSRALYVATTLDLATLLGNAALPVAELAGRAGADEDALHRLLRLLVASGVFKESRAGRFANNNLSNCLRSDMAGNIRDMILMHHSSEMSRPWYEQLEYGVRTGRSPFQLTHGDDLFEYMDRNPAFDALFARAMDAVEPLAGDSYATELDWGRFRRVIDVGGSNGVKAGNILRRYPDMTAVIVDRSQVIDGARRRAENHPDPRLHARMRFVAGDILQMFPFPAEAGDVLLLSAVLHGFSDDDAVRALVNVRDACTEANAPVVIAELILPECGASLAEAGFDMQMFIGSRGRERTRADWQRIVSAAGFAWIETIDLVSFARMIVLRPSR